MNILCYALKAACHGIKYFSAMSKIPNYPKQRVLIKFYHGTDVLNNTGNNLSAFKVNSRTSSRVPPRYPFNYELNDVSSLISSVSNDCSLIGFLDNRSILALHDVL